MARKVRDKDLDSRTARSKLRFSGKPYYRALDEGLHIGYRKGKASGKWVVRYYLANGKYEVETLDGVANDKGDPDGIAILSFAQAQNLARKKHGDRQAARTEPPAGRPYTVRNALEDYLRFLKEKRRTERDARYRAEAFILPMLGDIAGRDLTNEKLQAWLAWLAEQPPRVRSRKKEEQQFRAFDPNDEEAQRRRQSSAMRVWTILKAALNQAWRARKRRTVRPFEDVDAARVRWLTNEESRRLINASSEGEFRTLVRAALQTGVRFGALASLDVDDFSVHPVRQPDGTIREQGNLHILTRKGRGGKVKHVSVMLTYGRWLAWLDSRDLLDDEAPPGDRISPDWVRSYAEHLEGENASATVITRLIELKVMASIMDPNRDWSWIYRMASVIRARHRPARPKRHRRVPIVRLFGLGLDLMAGAEDETTALRRFKAYREGLMIAFLAARPLRLRNLTGLFLDHTLVRRGDSWWIQVPAAETKTKVAIEVPWPKLLTPRLGTYLTDHRAAVAALRGFPSDALGCPCTVCR